MKFMITWQLHQGKLHEGYSKFFKMTPEQDAADRGSRIKQIGRWHDLHEAEAWSSVNATVPRLWRTGHSTGIAF